MNTIMTLLAVMLLISMIIASVTVIANLSRKRPEQIELADDFKTGPSRFGKLELEERRMGASVTIGTDIATGQPYVIPEKTRRSTTLIVGRTGVGKSTTMVSGFMEKDMKNKDVALVVFESVDPDVSDDTVELSKEHGREVISYPDAGFNPLGGWGTSEERAEAFGNLFAQINGDTTSDAGKYFLRQAQLFIRRVIPLFEAAYHCPMTLRELYLLATNTDIRARVLQEAGDCPESLYFIEGTKAWTDKMWAANTADLCGMIDAILVGDRKKLYCDRNAPCLEDQIQNKKVIIIKEGSYKNTTEHVLGLMFMIKVQEFARRREKREDNPLVAVYIDEAYQYFNDQYPAFLSQCRHKNIAQTLVFQSLKHLEPHTTLLATNASTWIILPGMLPEDATFVADTIGKRLHRYRTYSREDGSSKGSETIRYEYSYLVEPHRIMEMSEGHALVLSQRGRQKDVHRFVELVPPLELNPEKYREIAVDRQAMPGLKWDEIQTRKLDPPLSDQTGGGDHGSSEGDMNGQEAPDWLVDKDEDEHDTA